MYGCSLYNSLKFAAYLKCFIIESGGGREEVTGSREHKGKKRRLGGHGRKQQGEEEGLFQPV